MKKTKHTMRSLAFLLALMMLAVSLTACGGKEQTPAPSDGADTADTADDYPNKTVTIICPWGVGGGADTIARKITQVAEKYFDQPLIVENHTGASGTIGMGDAFDAPADGYTLSPTAPCSP